MEWQDSGTVTDKQFQSSFKNKCMDSYGIMDNHSKMESMESSARLSELRGTLGTV